MAASFSADQINTVSRLQVICSTILDQIHLAQVIAQEAIDKGYGAGGANVITDALLQNPGANGSAAPAPQLTAADVAAAVAFLQKLDAAAAATTVTVAGVGRVGYIALEKMRP